MPTYRFKNMNTGEEYDEFMSNNEREADKWVDTIKFSMIVNSLKYL